MAAEDQGPPRFKIGAVERLTGIPASSIRVWERRYGAVEPGRSDSGTRYYSENDVERLKLIRELTDGGDAISEVARLPLDALRERRREFAQGPGAPGGARRVVFIGHFDERLLDQVRAREGIEEVVSLPDMGAASSAGVSADIAVVAMPTLHRDQLSALHALRRELGAARLGVVYRFATAETLAALSAPEVLLLRGPLPAGELFDSLFSSPGSVTGKTGIDGLLAREIAAPRFSADQLERVAALDSRVRCECPHHLADLISGLQAFEQYSAECESRSKEDARFHARLGRGAGLCRDILESLLEEALHHEQIDL